MADTTISSLNTINALSANNFIPISDGTNTTKLGTDSLFGFRNYIINGDFRVDQRNAGDSVVVNTGGPSVWTGPDRFFSYQNSPSTNVSIQRQSVDTPVGFANALKWGRSGSGTPGGVTVLASALETDQSIPLAGKTVTLSFYAKKGANFSSLNSQLGAMLISGTGVNQSRGEMITFAWSGVVRPIETAVTLSSSWQQFTLTGTVAANCKQLGLYFSWTTTGVAGADDNAYITGIQLEEGPTATPFERRPIGMELALCQRYYEFCNYFSNRTYLPSSGAVRQFTQFKVTKRIIPNPIIVTNSSNTNPGNVSLDGVNYPVSVIASTTDTFNWETTAGSPAGNIGIEWHATASAEL